VRLDIVVDQAERMQGVVRLDIVADQAEGTRLIGGMMVMTGRSHRPTSTHNKTKAGPALQIHFSISPSLNVRLRVVVSDSRCLA